MANWRRGTECVVVVLIGESDGSGAVVTASSIRDFITGGVEVMGGRAGSNIRGGDAIIGCIHCGVIDCCDSCFVVMRRAASWRRTSRSILASMSAHSFEHCTHDGCCCVDVDLVAEQSIAGVVLARRRSWSDAPVMVDKSEKSSFR